MEEKGEQIINRKHGWLRPVSRTAYSCWQGSKLFLKEGINKKRVEKIYKNLKIKKTLN
jgi:hypothetical protein